MLEERLQIYRQERKTFILGLKHYYGIDFYKLDRRERKEWLYLYIKSRHEFLANLIKHRYGYPTILNKISGEKNK